MGLLPIIYMNKNNFAYSQINVGLASIYTHLRTLNHDISIYDTNSFSMKEIVSKVTALDSTFVGFSTTEPHFRNALLIANEIKSESKKTITIFGGPYPTISPEDCLSSGEVDYVCVGDGEYALQEMLSGTEVPSIQGIWYKSGNKIMQNGVSKPFDINSLIITDYSAFSRKCIVSERFFGSERVNLAFTWSARSCKYTCAYCCNYKLNQILKYGMRYRKIENLVLEIRSLKDIYHPDGFFLSDEDFLFNRNHSLEFAFKYGQARLGLPFGFLSRPEHICDKNLPILKNLRDAGWKWVSIGVEIGNEHKRGLYLKRKNHNKDIIKAFEICRELGIYTNVFLIVGFYFEDEKDFQMTIDLMGLCKPDNIECSIYYPLSESQLGEYYKKTGLISKSTEIKNDYFNDCIIKHPLFSEQDIKKQQNFFKKQP